MRILKKHFNRVRHKCWKLIDIKYPEAKTNWGLAKDLIIHSLEEFKVTGKIRVLDTGCGHDSWINFHSNPDITLIGTDIVLDDIKNNKDIDCGFICNLEQLSLKDKSVDIISSNMVLEHLSNPDIFFNEVNRVLRKDGYLIFQTPCIYNIVVIFNRLIPDVASKKLGAIITGSTEDDIFPTKYRANSIKRLRYLGKKNNLRETDLTMYQPAPWAFVFSTILCRLIIHYYKIINKYNFLKSLRGVIVARYKKH